ncbi:META domain-containing protein [Micromonospora sp. RTGN7]|uniref:META domain-containing protein n=1 Tax=Micromonospora sp. RTGN7 TaxID=3016526 RepID=UPI0029FF4255|nr:META domain-containing protein [Micromonospora sp. RTGN7]
MQAVHSTRPGGHVGYVGVTHVELPGLELFFSGVHLHGGPAPPTATEVEPPLNLCRLSIGTTVEAKRTGAGMANRGYLAAMIACGVLLTGCAGQSGPGATDPGPGPGASESSGPPAPEGLIGSWTIADLADPGAATILRLAHRELHVVGNRCGILRGSWRADTDGNFLAEVNSTFGPAAEGTPGCERASQDTPGWLRRVTAYRIDGAGQPVLLDNRAQPVARLIPGATPTAGPDMAGSLLEPPTVTDEARRALAPAAALPPALSPADQQRLAGRWTPTVGNPGAYVEFTADGEWRGSDGCNRGGGRWITAPGGTLLATTGPVTKMGCTDQVPVWSWLQTTRRAGLDGEVLVLIDAQGGEAGRLHPAT